MNSTANDVAPSSQHHRVPGDRNIKTELHDVSTASLVVTSNEITPKAEIDNEQVQIETDNITKLDNSEDLKSDRKKIDPILENKDTLSRSNGISSKSKRAKADNEMKGNSVRPKHLTIDIIKKLVIMLEDIYVIDCHSF